MTENKRFIIDDDGIVTDMVDLSMYIDNKDCCEKLNELNDENSELKIENDELKREVNLLTEFFRKNNFSLDDFNEWLTKEKWRWEAKEAWSERFGD